MAAAAHANGLTQIDHVILSDDASRASAAQGTIGNISRFASIETMNGINASLLQSTQQWQEAEQQQAQAKTHAQLQTQVQVASPAPQQQGPVL